jgi:hypothetical protein
MNVQLMALNVRAANTHSTSLLQENALQTHALRKMLLENVHSAIREETLLLRLNHQLVLRPVQKDSQRLPMEFVSLMIRLRGSHVILLTVISAQDQTNAQDARQEKDAT